jgi:UPF0755 protein
VWGWLLKIIATLILLTALGAGLLFYKAREVFIEPLPIKAPIIFEIKNGSTLGNEARKLVSDNIAITPYIFHFGLYVLDMKAPIKAGEYELTPGMSARDVLLLFQKGSNYLRQVTLPEGLTSYEIVQILNAVQDLSGTIETIPAEGSFLPETYSYRKDEPRSEVIKRMQDALTKTLDTAWEGRTKNLPITTKEDALILASIVEKETGTVEERRRVAGVFINRLRRNMPLQTDPTVIYAITKGAHKNDGQGPLGRRLLSKDLEINSPYNTYLYTGLPPTPIANAGKASIEAALNPETHEFIYFVADGTGGHAFAKTLAEHNANVAKWRKIKK